LLTKVQKDTEDLQNGGPIGGLIRKKKTHLIDFKWIF
jgi:hypothetical protein